MAEDQTKNAVIRAQKVLTFVLYGEEATLALVEIVDAQDVDGAFRVLLPNAVKNEGGPYDIVGGHLVAKIY